MTLNDIQIRIATRFDSTTSTPATDGAEYARRRSLINDAERQLRKANKWNFLRISESLSTVVDQAFVSLPANYRGSMADFDDTALLDIGDTQHKLILPNQVNNYTTGTPLAWITGNDASGYQLNLSPTPTAITSFTFSYYTKNMATDTLGTTEKEVLALVDDVTKIPDPLYVVYYVLHELYPSDDDMDNRGINIERKMNDSLEEMIANDQMGDVNVPITITSESESRGLAPMGGYASD
jgi:hypothetical protein